MSLDRERERQEKGTPYDNLLRKKKEGYIKSEKDNVTFMVWKKVAELTNREDVTSIDDIREKLVTEGIGIDQHGEVIRWPLTRKSTDKLFRRVWGTHVAKEKIRDMKTRKALYQKYQKYYELTHEQEVNNVFASDYMTTADSFELGVNPDGSLTIMPITTVDQARKAGYRKVPYTYKGEFGVDLAGRRYDFTAEGMVRHNLRRAIKKKIERDFERKIEEEKRRELRNLNLDENISDKELAKKEKRIKRNVKARLKESYLKPRLSKVNNEVDRLIEEVKAKDSKAGYVHGFEKGHPIDWEYCPAYASKDKAKRGEQRMRALPGRAWSRATLNIPFIEYTPPKRVQIASHAIAKNQGGHRLIQPEPPAFRAEFNDLEGLNARLRLPENPRENLLTSEAGLIISKDFANKGKYVYISPVKELIVQNLGDLKKAPKVDEEFSLDDPGKIRMEKLDKLALYPESFVRRGDMLVRHTFPNFGRVQYAADHTGHIVYIGNPTKKDGTLYYRTLESLEKYPGCLMPTQKKSIGASVKVKETKAGKKAEIVEVGGDIVCGEEIKDGSCPVHGEINKEKTAEFSRPKVVEYYRQKYQIIRPSDLKVGDKLFSRNGIKGVIADIQHDIGKDEKGRPYEVIINADELWQEGPMAREKGKQKSGVVLERKVSDGTVFLFLDGEFSADSPFTPKSGLSISTSLIGGLTEKDIDVEQFNRAYMQGTLLPDILKALHLKVVYDSKTNKAVIEPDTREPKPSEGYTIRNDPDIIRKTHTVNGHKYDYMYVPPWVARHYFSQGSIRQNTLDYEKLFEQVVNRFSLLPTYTNALNLKAVAWAPPHLTDDKKVIMNLSDAMMLGYDPKSNMPFRVSIRKEPVSIAESIQTYEVVVDSSEKYKNCIGIHPLLAKKGIIDFDGDEVVAFTPALTGFEMRLDNDDKKAIRDVLKWDWKDLEKKSEAMRVSEEELAKQCAEWNERQFQDDKNISDLGGLRKRYTVAKTDTDPVLRIVDEDVVFTQRRVNEICNVEKIMKFNVPFTKVKAYAKDVLGPKNANTVAQQKKILAKIGKEDPQGEDMVDLVKEEIMRRKLNAHLKQKGIKNPYYVLFSDPQEITQRGGWEGFLQFKRDKRFKMVVDPDKRFIDRLIMAQLKGHKDIWMEK